MEDLDTNNDIPVVSDNQADFELETQGQISDSIETLHQIPEIQPQNWEGLDEGERLDALQNVENEMAVIQGRENIPVIFDHNMDPDTYGGYNGSEIRINANHVMFDKPVEENIDTIIHEGRHAYQEYAINNPGTVTDNDVVAQWNENRLPGNYLTAEMYGQSAYENQPIEADAYDYAGNIINGLYGERE